jgi:AcrR family transcriptional regulator
MKQTRRNNQRWVHKHETIMEAAADIFLVEGYAATNMDAIAKRAGISKITIYKHFESKNRLFNEMMSYHCQTLYKDTPIILFSLKTPTEKILINFAKKLIELLSLPRSISLMRLVIAESEKFPEIVSAVWEGGRMPLQDIFSEYLAEEIAHQRMVIENIPIATKQFFGMIKESFIWPALTGMQVPKAKHASEIIEITVAMFLSQYQKL